MGSVGVLGEGGQDVQHVANALLEDERTPLLARREEAEESGSEQQAEVSFENVQREAWTKEALTAAYSSLFLMASCVSLEGQTIISLSAYATSAFKKHAMLSTIMAIQGVVNAVVKAPMAKFANVFGRLETYVFVVSIYTLGYILMAGAPNFTTYACGMIFYSAGGTSLQISQQIFIADTTNLLNRALFTRLPDIPYLFTVWIGPGCAQLILEKLNWRWGYGIWAILLPITSLPLIGALGFHRIRMKKLGKGLRKNFRSKGSFGSVVRYSKELDVIGFVLFSLGLGLTLMPISMVNTTPGGFEDANIRTPLVFGVVCLGLFVWHEVKVASSPLVPLHLFRSRTVVAGCALAFWYFMAFYFSVQPYLFSYLQVVHSMSVSTAGRITQTFGFMATVSAVIISLFIKRTRRYRRFAILGCVIYVLGLVSMLFYRTKSASAVTILASQIIVGMGGGIVNVSTQVGIQASIDPSDVAAATAMFLTALEMGGAVGSAISGAIWTRVLPGKLKDYLPDETRGEAQQIFEEISRALSYPAGTATRAAIDQSYQETMDILMLTAICISVAIIPLAMSMRSVRL